MFPKNFKEATKTGFIPYILEAEGYDNLCTTRNARINAAIKDFKNLVNNNIQIDDYTIAKVLANHGLTEDSLSEAEKRKMMREVNGY